MATMILNTLLNVHKSTKIVAFCCFYLAKDTLINEKCFIYQQHKKRKAFSDKIIGYLDTHVPLKQG